MNVAWLLVGAGASLWTGWWLVRWLSCSPVGFGAVRMCLAIGLGLAVGGAHYCVWRASYPQGVALYRIVDCLVIPLAAWLVGRGTRSPMAAIGHATSGRCGWILGIVTVGVVGAGLAVVGGWAWREPLGIWDGWAIWNLKARFLYRGGANWTAMFSRELWFSHPDYPLLLPAAIARFWSYLGEETTLVPRFVSIGYSVSVMGLLFTAVAWFRGTRLACYALLALVSSAPFLYYGGGQVADVPMSLYVLGATVAMAAAGRFEPVCGRLWVLAGMLAGCAAMLKNEGLVVCLAMLVGMIVWRRFGRGFFLLAAGMAPGLVLVAAQKLYYAAASYLVVDQPSVGAVLAKLGDGWRHGTILRAMWDYNFGIERWFVVGSLTLPLPRNLGLVVVIVLLVVWGVRRLGRDALVVYVGWTVIALTVAAYYVTLLAMPYDLAELVKSLPRLQLHLWPALILVVCLMVGSTARGEAGKSEDAQERACG